MTKGSFLLLDLPLKQKPGKASNEKVERYVQYILKPVPSGNYVSWDQFIKNKQAACFGHWISYKIDVRYFD